jgi:hypothetical protein
MVTSPIRMFNLLSNDDWLGQDVADAEQISFALQRKR